MQEDLRVTEYVVSLARSRRSSPQGRDIYFPFYPAPRGGDIIFKILGKKYEEREKKRRGKRRKKKKREKINKVKNYDKLCYLRGEKRFIFPQSVRYLLGGKNFISKLKGGGI